jgi:hypothetical protein
MSSRCWVGAGWESRRSAEQRGVVEFGLVDEDVRVDVGRNRELALTDELCDSGPGNPAQVQEADPPMAQVVRTPKRDPLGAAGLRDRRPQRVRARGREQSRLRVTEAPKSASSAVSWTRLRSAGAGSWEAS